MQTALNICHVCRNRGEPAEEKSHCARSLVRCRSSASCLGMDPRTEWAASLARLQPPALVRYYNCSRLNQSLLSSAQGISRVPATLEEIQSSHAAPTEKPMSHISPLMHAIGPAVKSHVFASANVSGKFFLALLSTLAFPALPLFAHLR